MQLRSCGEGKGAPTVEECRTGTAAGLRSAQKRGAHTSEQAPEITMGDHGKRGLLLSRPSTLSMFLPFKSHHLAKTLLANRVQFSVEDGFGWAEMCRYARLGRAWANLSGGTVVKQQGPQRRYHGAGNGLDSAGDRTDSVSQMFSVPCLPHCQIHVTYKQNTLQTAIFLQASGDSTVREVREGENSLGPLYRPDVYKPSRVFPSGE